MNHERESQRPVRKCAPLPAHGNRAAYPPTKIEPPYPPPAGRALTCPRKSSRPTLRLLARVLSCRRKSSRPVPPKGRRSSAPAHAHRDGRARGTPGPSADSRATPGRRASRPRPGGPIRHPSSPGMVPGFPPPRRPAPRTRLSASGAPATLAEPTRRPRRWHGLARTGAHRDPAGSQRRGAVPAFPPHAVPCDRGRDHAADAGRLRRRRDRPDQHKRQPPERSPTSGCSSQISRAPQPLSQSVAAGQNTVDVTVAVQGSGHGSGSRTVTLQILGPDTPGRRRPR